MKYISKIILVATCLMLATTTLVTAVTPTTVVLFEKDPTTWAAVPDSGVGTFTMTSIKVFGSRYLYTSVYAFEGFNLETDNTYTLISYKEPWPGTGSIVIGQGTADICGVVSLSGRLPLLVYNTYTSGEYAGQTGAKIWLVLSSDFVDGHFVAWHPTEYLFETHLI